MGSTRSTAILLKISVNALFQDMAEFTQEQKDKYIKYFMECKARELSSLYVIYNPSCGCKIDQDVLLDRYPMSRKIICCTCPECKKPCSMEISEPIRFYLPLLKAEIPFEKLHSLQIEKDHYQLGWIFYYLMDSLEFIVDRNMKEFKKRKRKKK